MKDVKFSFLSFFLQSVVEEQIYPNVTTGFTDSNAYLRELTLKSMLTLAPKLSQKTLSNSLLKFLAKLQVSCTDLLLLLPLLLPLPLLLLQWLYCSISATAVALLLLLLLLLLLMLLSYRK